MTDGRMVALPAIRPGSRARKCLRARCDRRSSPTALRLAGTGRAFRAPDEASADGATVGVGSRERMQKHGSEWTFAIRGL